MLISHRYKFINIAIPATASISTWKTLRQYSDVVAVSDMDSPYYHHAESSVVKKELPDIWDSYFKFCFVRNPWERIISHYFSSSQGDWHGRTYDYAKIPFDDFVETHVLSEVGCLMCKKQSVWYTGLDYIGRFENYEDSIHTIFRKIGINQEPEIFKVNTTNHKSYREYYNDRTAMMVYEKFKDEIEYLGYEYEN